MLNASKRIPLTNERWAQLNDLKQAGETYDELLRELIRGRYRRNLSERTKEVRESDHDELTPLHEV
jgi:predicted CopG family antitoxin